MKMLQTRDLTKIYELPGQPPVLALKGINLDVERGEFVALLGQSGSGKSTLGSILGCVDLPTTGQYIVDGREPANMSPEERCRLRLEVVGLIFQSFHLMPHLTALENVMLPLSFADVPRALRKQSAMEALARCKMVDRADHRPSQLSGGQQQRVAIARAVVNNPQLLLADEPTGALDSKTGDAILDLLLEMQKGGTTVVMITHDLQIASHADRRICLHDGEIVELETST